MKCFRASHTHTHTHFSTAPAPPTFQDQLFINQSMQTKPPSCTLPTPRLSAPPPSPPPPYCFGLFKLPPPPLCLIMSSSFIHDSTSLPSSVFFITTFFPLSFSFHTCPYLLSSSFLYTLLSLSHFLLPSTMLSPPQSSSLLFFSPPHHPPVTFSTASYSTPTTSTFTFSPSLELSLLPRIYFSPNLFTFSSPHYCLKSGDTDQTLTNFNMTLTLISCLSI